MGKQGIGYKEISEYYEHLIRSGQLRPGQMLPTEPELARRHEVTRTTLRRAFSILVDKGLVVKRSGHGTFIAPAQDLAARERGHVAVITRQSFAEPVARRKEGHTVYSYASCSYYQFLEAVTGTLGRFGRLFRIYYHVETPEALSELTASIRDNGDCGILAIGIWTQDAMNAICDLEKPTVFVDSLSEPSRADVVNPNNHQGFADVAELLLETTGGPLAFVGSGIWIEGSQQEERFRGFLEGHQIRKRRFDEKYRLFASRMIPEDGRRLALDLLNLDPLPTGVACSDDGLAFGVIDRLRREGVAVPSKISVAGFGNSVYCLMTSPSITSVSPDRYEMGLRAVELLEKRIEDPQRAPVLVQVPTRLTHRQSTIPAASADMRSDILDVVL